MKNKPFLLIAFIILFTSCKEEKPKSISLNNEAQKDFSFKVETVVDGLEIPWGMAFLPDNSILITEKKGELIHFKNNKKNVVEGLPEIYVRGQGGLLDIELHPDYVTNGWIYFSYSSDLENDGLGGNIRIMRAQLKNNTLENKEVLYKATPNTKKG